MSQPKNLYQFHISFYQPMVMSIGIAAIIAKEICRLEEIIKLEDETQSSPPPNSTSAVVSRQQPLASYTYPPIGKYLGIAIVSAISAAFLIFLAVTIARLFERADPKSIELSRLSSNKQWPKSRQIDVEKQLVQIEVRGRKKWREHSQRNNDGLSGSVSDRGYRAYGGYTYRPDRPFRGEVGAARR